MDESPRDDSAAILVGRLIRSYRNDVRSNGKRLSQDGLLYLMLERGEEFAADLDRSSVSRWESGRETCAARVSGRVRTLAQCSKAGDGPDVESGRLRKFGR